MERSLKDRDKNPVIYAGSNSGILHAFDANTEKKMGICSLVAHICLWL